MSLRATARVRLRPKDSASHGLTGCPINETTDLFEKNDSCAFFYWL